MWSNKTFSAAVFVYLACAFRYGSEDLDVIGLSFRRDIWLKHVQIYPATDESVSRTTMQESLLKKVGEQGCPFSFQVGQPSPAFWVSVGLMTDYNVSCFYFFMCFRCQQICHAQSRYSLDRMIVERCHYSPIL